MYRSRLQSQCQDAKLLSVAVLCGGPSAEHEVSLASGRNVFEALDRSKFAPGLIIWEKGQRFPGRAADFSDFDVVFLALHGPFGEDGRVQAFLDLLSVPYTGSGMAASALGMDKIASKRIFQAEGIPTPEFVAVSSVSGATAREMAACGFPCVVKPSSQGSSMGVSIVRRRSQLDRALNEALKFDGRALIERYVRGREFSVGLLGNSEPVALPPIEIVPKNEFFDYEAKYTPDVAEEIVPARLDSRMTRKMQRLAVKVYQALGCRGLGRVDMLLGEDSKVYVLEMNTIPGMTENSLLPKEAKAAGIEFPELLEMIISFALER